MKITFFSTQPYDHTFFEAAEASADIEFIWNQHSLNEQTAAAINTEVICIFVNDVCNATVIAILAKQGVQLIALRCAGFNNVDLEAAANNNISIVRVPAYSPYAVAEHTLALLLTVNRKTHKAYNRVREQNFSLDGLLGFDLHGKTIGVIGTGNIGQVFCTIMLGMGCKVLAFDLIANKSMEKAGVEYTHLIDLFERSDIISLHCPLNESTQHIINAHSLSMMKNGVVIINSSRGALIETKDAIDSLKSGKIGALAIDVYEQESTLFFRDLSSSIIADDTIQRLMSFPNVLVTAHQAFFTKEALTQIASITLNNIKAWKSGKPENLVK
jgi:D-lactate dehydrogenase